MVTLPRILTLKEASLKDGRAMQLAMILGGVRLAFRKQIERYLADPKQFVLDFGDEPEVMDAAELIADAALETSDSYERRKQATADAKTVKRARRRIAKRG
jgi:hypothetical protein